MITPAILDSITRNKAYVPRKSAISQRLAKFGGPINAPPVLAQFLAQVMHESGGLAFIALVKGWGK